jgi:hypothetical protein
LLAFFSFFYNTMTKRVNNLNRTSSRRALSKKRKRRKPEQEDPAEDPAPAEDLLPHDGTGISSDDSDDDERLGGEELFKIRQDKLKAVTSATMRRHAIAFHYLTILEAPPKEKWDGKGGTVSQIVARLNIPVGSSNLVRTVLLDVEYAMVAGVVYDGISRRPASVPADSIEIRK